MIDINEVYKLTKFILNNSQKKRLLGDEFNLAANAASRSLFVERIGLPNGYQPGRPVPSVAFEVTETVLRELVEFVSDPTELVLSSLGRMTYPSDYVQYSALRRKLATKNDCDEVVILEKEVEVVSRAELGKRLDSAIRPPSYDYPIAVQYATFMQFHPQKAGNCILEYLKYPVTVRWAYTQSATAREVYDAANSVHFEWKETAMNELTVRILRYFGINIRDNELLGYVAQMKGEGS